MGSTQSSPTSPTPLPIPVSSNNNLITTTNTNTTHDPQEQQQQREEKKQKRKKKAPPKDLKGFALVEYKCRSKKRSYDKCYRKKHSAFVVGSKLMVDEGGVKTNAANDEKGELEEVTCEDLFEEYKDCIYSGMLKDRKKRGLPSAKAPHCL